MTTTNAKNFKLETSACGRTEPIGDFVRKRRLRPVVLDHLEESMSENEELGKRLAE